MIRNVLRGGDLTFAFLSAVGRVIKYKIQCNTLHVMLPARLWKSAPDLHIIIYYTAHTRVCVFANTRNMLHPPRCVLVVGHGAYLPGN